MAIQNKLSTALAPLQRKLFDQQIESTGREVDVIRIKIVEDKYHDEEITVVNNEIISVALDIPGEIPLFRFRDINQSQISQKTGLFLYDIIPIEGYSKFTNNVEKGDILISTLSDEIDSTNPFILILRVSEIVGSFNTASLVWKKFLCSPHNVTLTAEIEAIITAYVTE